MKSKGPGRPSPAMGVAMVALVVALGGSAYAAATVGPNDIEDDAVRARHIAEGHVVSGAIRDATVRARDIADGAVGTQGIRNGRVFSADIANANLRGADLRADTLGAREIDESELAGPTGFSETLPSGRTLRGTFNLQGISHDGIDAFEGAEISFGHQLPSRPRVNVILADGPSTVECPGSAVAPAAEPGHLCLYVGQDLNVDGGEDIIVFDPTVSPFPLTASRYGAALRFDMDDDVGTGEVVLARGSWAVTAP